jgi:hypothetical protein
MRELLPLRKQAMPLEDLVEIVGIKRAGFDELQNPIVIFRCAGLERDSTQSVGRPCQGGCARHARRLWGDVFLRSAAPNVPRASACHSGDDP